jgi:hypothetical protein
MKLHIAILALISTFCVAAFAGPYDRNSADGGFYPEGMRVNEIPPSSLSRNVDTRVVIYGIPNVFGIVANALKPRVTADESAYTNSAETIGMRCAADGGPDCGGSE